jgi:diguanylate cyclase (GGDEF)-like protein/PAS domain S-box-containing protein
VIVLLDADLGVVWASPSLRRSLGLDPATVTRSALTDAVHPDDADAARRAVSAVTRHAGAVGTFEVRLAHSSGRWRCFEATVANRLGQPAVAGLVVTLRDVTDASEAAARLAYAARHDLLTGLPNRVMLLDDLRHALDAAEASGRGCAVLFVDLDDFKAVSDTLGHAVGDRLLQTTADRLRQVIRPGDTVARSGGDEFVVLAEGLDDPDAAVDLAERIRAAVSQAVVLPDRTVTIGCSIGIAISDGHGPEGLLEDADSALYRAKQNGRDRCEVFDAAMRAEAARRFDTEQLLRDALRRDRITVLHQPIVDLATGEVVGTEALARLAAGSTLIPPADFVEAAEAAGLIAALGLAVLRRACAQQSTWRLHGGGPRRVSVNVAAAQVASGHLVGEVTAALADHGLRPEDLCLELTESSLIGAGGTVRRTLGELRALGVTLAIDDFGTGWSSLAYLRRLPVDAVKIDRSFVAGLGRDGPDAEVVRAVVGLAHALGLTCVAEGVETAEQVAVLRALGCDQAQGHFFARPQPAADLWPVARPALGA